MRYTMKPAGHKAPEEKREYVRPDSRLQSVFEEWFAEYEPSESINKTVARATTALTNLEATVEEAHGLIITYKDHPKIIEAGIFLSAIYQNVTEQQITYDLDIPLHVLGYKLPAEKTLTNNGTTGDNMGWCASGSVINNGETGNYMGWCASGPAINNGTTGHNMSWEASGPVINNGTTGDFMGWYASGPVINNGETGDWMGEYASGIVLALKEPESYGNLRKARIFKPEQIESNPELHDYLTKLCEQTKAFDEYSVIPPNFTEAIKQEIKRLSAIEPTFIARMKYKIERLLQPRIFS